LDDPRTTSPFGALRRRFAALADLPASEWEWFRAHLRHARLAPGEAFIEKGDSCRPVAFVVEGLVKTSYLLEDGSEVIRNFSAAGDFLAAIVPLLSGELASDVTIRALEPTRLVVVDHARLVDGYARDPAWERLGRRLAEGNYLARERRQRELLLEGVDTRVARFFSENAGLAARLRQRDVAAYLGIEPETLSRVRARLRAKRRDS